MNGNTSFSPSCTRYESASESMNGSYVGTLSDGSFIQQQDGASGGSDAMAYSDPFDPVTPQPPVKSRMSFFSMKQFDPLLKTPHSPVAEVVPRPSPISESPAADVPIDGPLIPVTPVTVHPIAVHPVTVTPAAVTPLSVPVSATPVTVNAATPIRQNGVSANGLREAFDVISILKSANEELLQVIVTRDQKIAQLTEDLEKLQTKMRKITSLTAD